MTFTSQRQQICETGEAPKLGALLKREFPYFLAKGAKDPFEKADQQDIFFGV